MKKFYFGRLSLTISIAAFLTSCDRPQAPKYEPAKEEGSSSKGGGTGPSYEGRFSAWTSKAGLEFQMEHLPGDQYFSVVEGRLNDGANQYRAITETFDDKVYLEWSVCWGLAENELAVRELDLLRRGFSRHHAQVFTDSAGRALHQLTMLRRIGIAGDSQLPVASSDRPEDDVSPSILGSSDDVDSSTNMAEVDSEKLPDFIKPELRQVDDGLPATTGSESESDTDAASEVSNATSITSIEAGAAPPEVVSADSPESKPEVIELPNPVEQPESVAEPEAKVEPKPEVKVEPKPKLVTHRVAKGDTLSKIARRYGVSVSAIKRANSLRSDIIRLRQVLKIPKK